MRKFTSYKYFLSVDSAMILYIKLICTKVFKKLELCRKRSILINKSTIHINKINWIYIMLKRWPLLLLRVNIIWWVSNVVNFERNIKLIQYYKIKIDCLFQYMFCLSVYISSQTINIRMMLCKLFFTECYC